MTILRERQEMTLDLLLLWPGEPSAFFCIVLSGWIRRGDIAFWIFNYMPHWEAASKEAQMLLRAFGAQYTTQLFSLNQNRHLRLRGQEKYLPLPEALAAFPLLYQVARSHRVNHLFSSGGERLLAPRLSQRTSILTICKEPGSIDAFERNRQHLARFQYIVVESRRHKEIMKQCGIDEHRIKLIYPPAAKMVYKPAQGPFKILFASSPPGENQFLSRGIFLILRAAQRLPEVQFTLVWRDRHHEALRGLIREAGVDNVSVINGYVDDMGALYDRTHATVLAGHDYASFKPAPHSALESLGRGKPVLVTPTSSIADIVRKGRCGVVFEPKIASFEEAIRELMGRYQEIQPNCHRTVDLVFSKETFIERYRLLYEELLAGSDVRAALQPRAEERGGAGVAVRP
jgi:glycosyltransferase involved in cell wall biosynthesis